MEPNKPQDQLTTLNDNFHLFITFGDELIQKTHLGGYPTTTAAIMAQVALQPKAAKMFPAHDYRFLIVGGPVHLAKHELQYGGPWDKD